MAFAIPFFTPFHFWTGVDLFFAISGFIVTKSLLQNLDAAKTTGQISLAIRSFFIRRIFRIIPSAYLWVLIPLILSLIFNSSGHFPNLMQFGQDFLLIALNVYNFFDAVHSSMLNIDAFKRLAPYWSLSIEEQFYFVIPFAMIVVRKNSHRLVMLCGTLLLINFLIRPAFLLGGISDINFFQKFTLTRADALICGSLLYIFSKCHVYRGLEPVFLRHRCIAIFTMALLLLSLARITKFAGLDALSYISLWPVVNLLVTIPVFIASFDKDYLKISAPMDLLLFYLAKRFYTLYLAHWTALWSTWEVGLRFSLFLSTLGPITISVFYLIVYIFLTVLFTEFSYRLVELPMIKLGKRVVNTIAK
jgi:peptidoglycan/LPS O-acetylase OafA/YrhL